MRLAQRFFSRWQNWVSFLLILTYIGVALAAPYLSPDDPKNPGPFMRAGKATDGRPQPPSEKALLGMLPFGVDVYHALVWGSRDALQFGLAVTVITAFFGVLYGATSGFVGNRLGNFMIRISDSFLAFPPIAGMIFLQQLFATTVTAMGGTYFSDSVHGQLIEITGPMTAIQYLLEHVNPLMLSLIVFSWMPYARLVHSIVLTLKQTEFVQAARALGGSIPWIIRQHILRNSTGPAIVLAARDVGGVVLLQATLTFVQIGGDSIWGTMLAQGRNWVIGPGGSLLRYWWVFLPPTFAVMLFGIAWNMFGDGLNEVLEPGFQRSFRRRSLWPWGKKREVIQEPVKGIASVPAISVNPLPVAEKSSRSEPVRTPVSTNGIDPVLAAARDDISRGDVSQALHAYGYLVRRNRQLDEVLPDLARLAKTYPREPRVWQTLGDALSRAGRSEHANQSYEQARKLKQ